MKDFTLKLQLFILSWLSGFTHIIDGIALLVSFGTFNTEFTEEIQREIRVIYLKLLFPWMK